ncbi:MAG: hypothetical protein ACI4XW_09505 [Candidatus Spyradocola sp.]
MAQKYLLVPLAEGPLSGLDLVARAVLGALYDRIKLSSYNTAGGDARFYDPYEGSCFCIYAQQELADLVGVSERTIRRALDVLASDNLVHWRKASYRGACRYYIHEGIMNYLRSSSIRSNCPDYPVKLTAL